MGVVKSTHARAPAPPPRRRARNRCRHCHSPREEGSEAKDLEKLLPTASITPAACLGDTLFENTKSITDSQQGRDRGSAEWQPPSKAGDAGFAKAQTLLQKPQLSNSIWPHGPATRQGVGIVNLVGPGLLRLKQEHCKFEASLGYLVSSNQPRLCVWREALSQNTNQTSKTTKTGFCVHSGSYRVS